MRPFVRPNFAPEVNPPLSEDELTALRESCAPVGSLRFPPVEVIRTLRRHGYIAIVLGGIQVTPKGLERLVAERRPARPKLSV